MKVAEATPKFTPKRIKPTDEQRDIQIARKRIILIDANAGAAKTTTLALRIAESWRRGQQPENVLILVFTKAAKKAIKSRLSEVGVPLPVVSRFTIETFDDFAKTVLLKVEGGTTKSIDSNEQLRPHVLQALDNVCAKYAENTPLEVSTTNMAVTEFLKLQLRTKAKFAFHLCEFEESSLEDRLYYLGMSLTHYLWIREYELLRGVDTEDIRFRGAFDATYDLVRLLEDDPPLREWLPKFQIIIADELHDLNEATFRLLKMLIDKSNAFFCGAGDKDQVIYTWSGADHQFLRKRFDDAFPYLQRYPLTKSFRFGHQLAEAMGALKGKVSQSGLLVKTEIEVRRYDPGALMACGEQIAGAIQRWQAGGSKMGSVAILLRDRHQSIRVESALFRHDIAYAFVDMESFLESQEVLMMRGMLAIAQKDLVAVEIVKRRADILEALVTFAEVPLTQELFQKLKSDIRESPEYLEGFFTYWLNESTNKARANATKAAVEYLRSLPPSTLAADAFDALFQIMRLDDAAHRIYVDPAEANVVAQSIRGFIDVCRESGETLVSFSTWLGKMEFSLLNQKKPDIVTIACVDQVKGLEYEHVILPFLAAGEFPRRDCEQLEEQNRFYVAATRTKRRLTLLVPTDPSRASRFVQDMQIDRSVGRGDKLLRKAQFQATLGARDGKE